MKLTERKIEKLAAEPGHKDRLVFDDAQRGLAVRVTASGGRTFLCQYTLHGHKWRVPLGACSAVALSNSLLKKLEIGAFLLLRPCGFAGRGVVSGHRPMPPAVLECGSGCRRSN